MPFGTMKIHAWAKTLPRLMWGLCLGGALAEPVWAQTSDLVSENALRVCADPANYPMSAQDESGYENKLAEFVGEKLELPVQYTWFPMATGFVRNTLGAKQCDLIIGYAQGHELVLNTNHYFTSAYALIVPKDGPLADVDSLTDPALQGKRIGIVAGTPPAAHLARNGLIGTAKAYNLMVDRRHESPADDMLNELAEGELQAVPLVTDELPPRLFFRITMGVRLGEKGWQRELNSLIRRNQDEINALLIESGVPLTNDMGTEVMELSQ